MPRNTEGLKRSARLRSESARQRALAALQRMDASDREINFRTVAAEAGVSAAWLYSQEGLRGVSCDHAEIQLTWFLRRRRHGIESVCPSRT